MISAEDKTGPTEPLISAGRALQWNYLGNITRSGLQFLVGILLARLLGPEPFGIVAIAWLILGIGNLFADLGFGAALVQRASLTTADLRFIFTCQMALGAALTLAGVLGAGTIATYFHHPDATLVIQAMSCLFLFQSLGQTGAAMLRRALKFKLLQQVTIVSYLVGYVGVGIPAAWHGWGVWSLVAAQNIQSLLSSLLLLRYSPVPMAPSFKRTDHDIVRFGLKVTAANLSSWSISNLDVLFIGRAFGVAELGLYNRALSLVNMPMSAITTGFQGVLFAACARAQASPDALRRIYLETNAAVAALCFPLFLTCAAVPDTLVLALYGPAWRGSVALIPPLALAVLANALLAIKGPILMAGNRVGLELRNQLYTVLIFVPLLWMAVDYSLRTVAWAVVATYVIRWVLLAATTLRALQVPVGAYLASLRTPMLFGCCVSLGAALADRALFFLPPAARLLAVSAVAGAISLALARRFGAGFVKSHLGTFVNPAGLPHGVRSLLHI